MARRKQISHFNHTSSDKHEGKDEYRELSAIGRDYKSSKKRRHYGYSGRNNQQQAKQLADAKRKIQLEQPTIALELLQAGNPAVRIVAEQIIKNFRLAKADRSKNISLTAAAIDMLDTQLDPSLLNDKHVMYHGKRAAHEALTGAYRQLTARSTQEGA